MTSELERLKAWMQTRGYVTHHDLIAAMRYKGAKCRAFFAGEKPFSSLFKWRFALKFGAATTAAIFDLNDNERAHIGGKWTDAGFYPEKTSARSAVSKAITEGRLLPANHYRCVCCPNPARDWHHHSYEPEYRLDVLPLCRSCHHRIHRGSLAHPPIDAPRIAIATAP